MTSKHQRHGLDDHKFEKIALPKPAESIEVLIEENDDRTPSADRQTMGLPLSFVGRDELNLAEFPITLLADRAPTGQKTIEFQDKIYDEGEGKLINRKVTVTASDRFGLPTPKDDDVILGLIQLTKESNGFSNRTVRFNRADLVRLLGWANSGQSYQRIDQSLHRWLGVTLIYDNAWWDRAQSAWTTRGFHMIDNFELSEARGGDKNGEPLSRFTWNDIVFQSFQAGYMKRLELGIYLKLRLPTSKRIYRFLDKRFYHRRTWEFDLREFAIEHVGLSRSYSDNGKLKEKLKPAIDELTAAGFLEPMSTKDRYTKVSRSRWKIKFTRREEPPGLAAGPAKPRAKASPNAREGAKVRDLPCPAPSADDPTASQPTSISVDLAGTEFAALLVARGVTLASANELVSRYPSDRIQSSIETFDWLVARKDKKVSRNPAGYLVKSIHDEYVVPKGFETIVQQSDRLQAEQRKKTQVAHAKQQKDEAESDAERARRERIEAYWNSLSPADRSVHEDKAIKAANPSFRKRLLAQREAKGGALVGIDYLKVVLDAYIESLIDPPA